MTNQIIIIALLLALIYLYYQNRKLKGLPHFGNSTQTIFEVGENQEELIAEKDQAIRDKNEAEQEVLSLSNQLKLKNQEVSNKDQQIQRLKSEKSQSEIALNDKIKEWKKKAEEQAQITSTINQEKLKLQREYDKLEKKLENSSLRSSSPMPGEFPQATDYSLNDFISWLEKDETSQGTFEGVDWDFYRSKKDWMTSLKKWNTLRIDRLNLLQKWQTEVNKNHD